MLDNSSPYITTRPHLKHRIDVVCDFFLIRGIFEFWISPRSAFNQIINNMVDMPGRRTRNNSSVLIESIRLKTCLFIPARVHPSPARNFPRAFRIQTEYCILFRKKINSAVYTRVVIRPSYFFLKKREINMHKGNKVLLYRREYAQRVTI